MDPYAELLRDLARSQVRFLVIGVTGVNYYALPGQTLLATEDLDLFLPPDPDNTVRAWSRCEEQGFTLYSGGETLEKPLDLALAKRVVERRAAIRGATETGVKVDLTYVMAGYRFEELWDRRRVFRLADAQVPVAPLRAIVESKRKAGRAKDLLFLVSHDEILTELLGEEDEEP